MKCGALCELVCISMPSGKEIIDRSCPRLCQSCFTLALRIEVDLVLLSRFGLNRFDQEIGREVG